MRHEPIDPKLFVTHRSRLAELLPDRSLAVVNANDILPTNADGSLPLFPNADLYYLTGVEQERSILLLAPQAADPKMREILFVRETNDLLKVWEGAKLTKDEATRSTGIATIKWLEDFPAIFRKLMCELENVFLNTNEHPRAVVEIESRDARFIRDCRAQYPLHHYHRLAPLLHRLRIVKSPEEVALMRRAIEATDAGLRRVMRFVKPGVYEHEIEAELIHEFTRRRCRFAYTPIVGSGANSCVLHYIANDQPCKRGEVLLLDVGAAYANYNADLTRTIPVSGRFSRRQKQVYNAVLRVQRASIAGAVVGKVPADWLREAQALMNEELLRLELLKPADVKKQSPDEPACRKYFPHGLGHPLGIDVHDVGNTNEPMAAGWVMTVEPGIYIPDEGLGIRLENNILVTENGPVDLTADIPLEADEIEELMQQGK